MRNDSLGLMVTLVSATLVSRALSAPQEQSLASHVPGRVLVLVSSDTNKNGVADPGESLAGIANSFRGTLTRTIPITGSVHVSVVDLPEGVTVEEAVAANWKAADERILAVEPDYLVAASVQPNDPSFPQLWGLRNAADHDIDADEAWDLTTGGEVVIAVVDTGIDYNHSDLRGNMWVNAGEVPGDGIDNDGNGIIDDVHGVSTIGQNRGDGRF